MSDENVAEKKAEETSHPSSPVGDQGDVEGGLVKANPLSRSLKSRHMQMIAMGGAIGAGLFVGSGSALNTGGPGSLLIGFFIVGVMLLMTIQALGELAVMYPVNGAFFTFICRFLDPAWGFALGWDYSIGWLVILPFEITAAGLTIEFWRSDLNIGIWVAVFLVILATIQIFGVRGYGEVEFALSLIKIAACCGFIILGIVINCGGVPTDDRGYIGARYWHDPGAFRNGFKGFCTVFVTAAFALGGTEMTALAAAECANPRKSLPKACKQVFWRIAFLYILNIFILGLILPSDDDRLLNSKGANTKASPFVLAIQEAGIKGLPSVFNAVITIAVISVANTATYGSTRTIQALALRGMAPKWMAYVDKKGRPLFVIIMQISFGLLAFINESDVGPKVFNWLLALSGLSNFFIWGSVCLAHIRFRRAWELQGHSLDELAYTAMFGVTGSWIGFFLNMCCLAGQFFVSLFPVGGKPNAEAFFSAFLAGPVIIILYVFWKVFSANSSNPLINGRGYKLYVRLEEIDLMEGVRDGALDTTTEEKKGLSMKEKLRNLPKTIYRAFF